MVLTGGQSLGSLDVHLVKVSGGAQSLQLVDSTVGLPTPYDSEETGVVRLADPIRLAAIALISFETAVFIGIIAYT
jgi:hypothetical protein